MTLPVEGTIVNVLDLFPEAVREVWLEVGFGSGEHLVWQAGHHAAVGILGCEPFVNGVAALLASLPRDHRGRVRVMMDDARPLLERLPPGSLARVFLLFPDPWPKRRHARRRFIQPETLDQLARAMAPEAELRIASDHPVAQRWMLRHLLAHQAFAWTARCPSDFRERPDDWPATRYEVRATKEGADILYLRFRRRGRVEDEPGSPGQGFPTLDTG